MKEHLQKFWNWIVDICNVPVLTLFGLWLGLVYWISPWAFVRATHTMLNIVNYAADQHRLRTSECRR